MQHLKLLNLALLAAVCAFYVPVDGVPVYNKYAPKKTSDKSPQLSSKGYFGYLSSNPGTGSPQVSNVPSGKSEKVASAYNARATIDKSPQHSSKGYFAYFDGNSAGGSPRPPSSNDAPLKKESGGGTSILGAVGGGIASGVSGVMSGISDLGSGTVTHLANAFSAVTPESLSQALNVGELGKNLADKVDVTGVLGNVLSGQANPLNGVMNMETASLVLDKFGGLVPGLGPSVKALKTVSHVMKKMKAIQNENGNIDPKKLMMEAADSYFSDVDPNLKKKMIDLAPDVAKAASGDTAAAMKIASSLADPNLALEAVKAAGYAAPINLVQNVVSQAANYASAVKSAAGVAQKLGIM